MADSNIKSIYPGIETRGDDVEGSSSSSSSSTGGRSLHATRDFEPGELIALFTDPIVAIPAGPTAKSVCNQCLAPGLPAKACTGCKAVGYCGAACQKAHWAAVHRLECRAFRRVRARVQQDWLPTPVRALVQILLRRMAEEEGEEAIDRLAGNVEEFRAHEVWKDFEMQALAGCTYAGWQTTEDNLALAADILCKLQTNSFDRSDADINQTGTFLDPVLAMVNHSCIPNAIVAFTGRKAYLRAESPIAAGDEITISYIDYTKPKIYRQHGLELYHFECSCRRCRDDLDVYQVCQDSAVLQLNSFSFCPDIERLRKPPIDLKLWKDASFRAQIDKMYAACAPEARLASEGALAKLRLQWKYCEPLIRARMWALEPLAQVFQQAINYYAQQGSYLHALAIECFVAVNSDPYKYVAPFAQWRLKDLLMIAKTVVNTAVPSERGFKDVNPGIVATLEKTDEGSLYQAILLLVVHYGPMAHSEEWEVLAEAKSMLADVESLEARRDASTILHEWIRDSENPVAARFFRERAREPVERLAGFAIDVLKADLE